MPARTYMPDNGPVQVTSIAHGVDVVQPAEPQTGVEKLLRIQLPGDDATS